MMEQVRDVNGPRRFAPHHPHQPRMRLSERVHRDPAEEIQILFAVLIEEVAALAADKYQRRAPVGVHHVAPGISNCRCRRIEPLSLCPGDLALRVHCPTPAAAAGKAVVTRVPIFPPFAAERSAVSFEPPTTRTCETPAESARLQASSFRIIPPETLCTRIKSSTSSQDTALSTFLPSRTPATSVK